MSIEELQLKLSQLEREILTTRQQQLTQRLEALKASPDAKRQGLPPALLRAAEQARKALPGPAQAYAPEVARLALDDLQGLLDRYADWG